MKEKLKAILRQSVEGRAWHGPSSHTIHERVLHIPAWMDEATGRLYGPPPRRSTSRQFPSTPEWPGTMPTTPARLSPCATSSP